MRKLTIGFSKPKNKIFPIFSWLIRLYEGTPYSHVWVRWQTSVGPSVCYHAAHTTLHFLSDRCFERAITVVESFDFEVSDEAFNRMLKYSLETCGNDYALAGVLIVPILEFFKIKKNPFDVGDKDQYCAELVCRILGQIEGQDLTFDPDRVKLKEIYNFVKQKFVDGSLTPQIS